MLNKCRSCAIEAEWRERYLIAEKRFDKALRQACMVTVLAVITALTCVIISIFFGMKVLNFIGEFEYVEETTVEIEQDEGNNAAIIGGERNEVKFYGTEN